MSSFIPHDSQQHNRTLPQLFTLEHIGYSGRTSNKDSPVKTVAWEMSRAVSVRDGGLGPYAELGVSILQLLRGLTRLLNIEGLHVGHVQWGPGSLSRTLECDWCGLCVGGWNVMVWVVCGWRVRWVRAMYCT